MIAQFGDMYDLHRLLIRFLDVRLMFIACLFDVCQSFVALYVLLPSDFSFKLIFVVYLLISFDLYHGPSTRIQDSLVQIPKP